MLVPATTFALGLGLALVFNSERLKGQRFYRSLLILPHAMPGFAMLLVWRDMINTDFGLINTTFGLHVNWFGDAWTARLAVIIIQLRMGFPYMFLVCTGALQSIPGDLVHFDVKAPKVVTDDTKLKLEDSGTADTGLSLVKNRFVVSLGPRSRVRIGDKIQVAVDTERLHFFDPATGLAVRD